jgi:hypothetical protein
MRAHAACAEISAKVYKQLINAGADAFRSTERNRHIYKLLITRLGRSRQSVASVQAEEANR